MTFTPGENDVPFTLRLITESPNSGVWIDDIKLEEGTSATPFLDSSAGTLPLHLETIQRHVDVQGDGDFVVSFVFNLPREEEVEFRALIETHRLVRRLALKAGSYQVTVRGDARELDDTPRRLVLEARTVQGQVSDTASLRFYSREWGLRQLNALRQRIPGYERALAEMAKAGKPTQWARISLTVLQNFVQYVEEDLNHRVATVDGTVSYSEVRRALMQLEELKEVETHLQQELRNPSPAVRLWQCRGRRPGVAGGSFVDEAGNPLFFTGYGHFGQVRADMEKFPAYGVNLIQIEKGPSDLFPAEGVVNEDAVRELQSVLERAARANVAVNLLISPHYFPAWMLEKYPHLRKRRNGFLQYCLHAPESQQLLKDYLRTLIPPLSKYPALHSICLSNEPVSFEEPCEYAVTSWHRWLANRHSDIATLNRRWGTAYARFEDVPLPNPFEGSRGHLPSWYDYIRFNQEFFAGWHKMLADTIREVAPGIPIHAKAMTWTMVNDGDVVYGVDAYLFAQFSDINGNDSVNFYNHDDADYAQGWVLNALSHDLQRSMKNVPVFNSENHLIPDRETRAVPARHVHAALWEAAIHGQCATTIWVWERTFDPRSDFAGSIMHRPACAEAVGRVNLLLNRYAREVTAIQRAPADVLLIDSVTSKVWDGGAPNNCLSKLYQVLTFMGLKVEFLSERQLEEGTLPAVPVLFIANQMYLSDRAFETLSRYRGRLVFVGQGDLLRRNEYGQPREKVLTPDARLPFSDSTPIQDLWQSVRDTAPRLGLKPRVEVRDAQGKPMWGVAWRTAELDGKVVVNLCNYRQDAVQVRLLVDGQERRYRSPEETRWRRGAFRLDSLEIKLLILEK